MATIVGHLSAAAHQPGLIMGLLQWLERILSTV